MMSSALAKARSNEEGASTNRIILIVVGAVVGVGILISALIMVAIAVPAYLSQQQRVNDAGVESEIKNVATVIEAELVNDPNQDEITASTADGQTVILFSENQVGPTLEVGEGIVIETASTGSAGNYVLHGYHEKGKLYTQENPLVYDAASGGLQ